MNKIKLREDVLDALEQSPRSTALTLANRLGATSREIAGALRSTEVRPHVRIAGWLRVNSANVALWSLGTEPDVMEPSGYDDAGGNLRPRIDPMIWRTCGREAPEVRG